MTPLTARTRRCPNSYGATALIEIRDEPAQYSLPLGTLVFSPAAIRAAQRIPVAVAPSAGVLSAYVHTNFNALETRQAAPNGALGRRKRARV